MKRSAPKRKSRYPKKRISDSKKHKKAYEDCLKKAKELCSRRKSKGRKKVTKSRKPRRKLSKYNMFVKKHISAAKFSHLPHKKRMSEVAKLWRKQKRN